MVYAAGRDATERYPGDRYAAGGDAADEVAHLEAPNFQACHLGTPMRYEPAYGWRASATTGRREGGTTGRREGRTTSPSPAGTTVSAS